VSLLSRPQKRLKALDEAAAYSRCHGYRTQTVIAIQHVDDSPSEAIASVGQPVPLTRSDRARVSGEQLRQRFEQLLDARQKQE
jgi:hypothetical protein